MGAQGQRACMRSAQVRGHEAEGGQLEDVQLHDGVFDLRQKVFSADGSQHVMTESTLLVTSNAVAGLPSWGERENVAKGARVEK